MPQLRVVVTVKLVYRLGFGPFVPCPWCFAPRCCVVDGVDGIFSRMSNCRCPDVGRIFYHLVFHVTYFGNPPLVSVSLSTALLIDGSVRKPRDLICRFFPVTRWRFSRQFSVRFLSVEVRSSVEGRSFFYRYPSSLPHAPRFALAAFTRFNFKTT